MKNLYLKSIGIITLFVLMFSALSCEREFQPIDNLELDISKSVLTEQEGPVCISPDGYYEIFINIYNPETWMLCNTSTDWCGPISNNLKNYYCDLWHNLDNNTTITLTNTENKIAFGEKVHQQNRQLYLEHTQWTFDNYGVAEGENWQNLCGAGSWGAQERTIWGPGGFSYTEYRYWNTAQGWCAATSKQEAMNYCQ